MALIYVERDGVNIALDRAFDSPVRYSPFRVRSRSVTLACDRVHKQDGIRGTGRPQQNVGIIAVRVTPHSAGRDHRQHGDRGQSAKSAQRAHVPDLFGHAEKDYDHQGVSAPILLGLHHYGFTER